MFWMVGFISLSFLSYNPQIPVNASNTQLFEKNQVDETVEINLIKKKKKKEKQIHQ